MDIFAYLDRIVYRGPRAATIETLKSLHRAHMFSVPFENLDIGLGRTIVCDQARFLHKIVDEHRGGFCYELNGAFAALLRALDFRVTMLSARVSHADGRQGPDFDHMALLVDLQQPWLADVGFGDSFVEPLRLEPGVQQEQASRLYRIDIRDGRYRYLSKIDGAWKDQYSFTLQPHRLPEFSAMCQYQQTSPDSHFTHNSICSLATPEGRVTLSGDKLIETTKGQKQERVIDQAARHAILSQRFGIRLPAS